MSGNVSAAETIARDAKAAFEASQLIEGSERVRALHEIKKELESSKDAILSANKEDLAVRKVGAPSFLLADALRPRQPRLRSMPVGCPRR